MTGNDARGLIHWVPSMRWSACGIRVVPSDRDFPTCMACMAAWTRAKLRNRSEHAFDEELLR